MKKYVWTILAIYLIIYLLGVFVHLDLGWCVHTEQARVTCIGTGIAVAVYGSILVAVYNLVFYY